MAGSVWMVVFSQFARDTQFGIIQVTVQGIVRGIVRGIVQGIVQADSVHFPVELLFGVLVQ